VIERLRHSYREIVREPAGRRFHRYHKRRHARTGRGRRMVYSATGLLLVILGLVLSLPPLLPGFLLWVPGLALIAGQSGVAARALDRIESGARRLYRWLRGHREAP
jgi:hypothetical protein